MSDINEFIADTNEVVIRAYTAEELELVEADRNRLPEFDTVEAPENQLLTSAMNKLQSLGLTIDEAKAIIGI